MALSINLCVMPVCCSVSVLRKDFEMIETFGRLKLVYRQEKSELGLISELRVQYIGKCLVY